METEDVCAGRSRLHCFPAVSLRAAVAGLVTKPAGIKQQRRLGRGPRSLYVIPYSVSTREKTRARKRNVGEFWPLLTDRRESMDLTLDSDM